MRRSVGFLSANHAVAAGVALAAAVGCGGASASRGEREERPPLREVSSATRAIAPAGDDWPSELIASDGGGPALYLHERQDAPAIGYITRGTPVRVMGRPVNDRIPIRIGEPLKVRAWLAMSRLGALVQRRGRVRGAPAYVGPNDLVRVVDAAGPRRIEIELAPVLDGTLVLGPFRGSVPVAALGGAPAPSGSQAPDPGSLATLPAGVEVPVYARPGGSVVATLPARTPPLIVSVLRERGEWKGIRAGTGPYVSGYVNVTLARTEGPLPAAMAQPGPPAALAPGALPARISAEANQPLWRVRQGAKLRFEGEIIGIFTTSGYAREMNRYASGEVDVFAAIDDRVALRGMVAANDLEELPVSEDADADEDALDPEPAAGPARSSP